MSNKNGSDKNGSDQGVHYHYHFYGYGAGPQGQPQDPQAQPQDQNGYYGAPQAADQQGSSQNASYQQDARAEDYAARPQQAPGFAPGAVPPGFPFPPGAPFQQQPNGAAGNGQAAGNNGQAAGAAAGGLNWHQHPSADSLIKGLAIGAGAAYLLTNETAQRTILRSAVQVWALLQNGIEELKERLQDAEAEVAAAAEPAEESDLSTTSGS